MKTKRTLRNCCAAVLSTAFLLALVPASRADLVYYVTLNTASLTSNSDAPFSLDLQLEQGSGNVANTVTLSNFVFLNGTASASPNFTSGGETGSFANTVALTNSSSNNEFAAAFSTQVTQISFKVDETSNSETVTSGTPIQDQFNVYIDDNNTVSGFVPTTATDQSNALVESTIVSGQTLASVQTFGSTSTPDPGVTAQVGVIPEPRSTAMLFIGGVLLAFWVRRKATRVCA